MDGPETQYAQNMNAEVALIPNLEDESRLVRRAKERDAAAWSELYDAYYQVLFRYAFVRLRRREDAEDVASQVFLEAIKGIDGYEDRGRPFLAWFYGIAHNLVTQ